jgi:hypothetical protein
MQHRMEFRRETVDTDHEWLGLGLRNGAGR